MEGFKVGDCKTIQQKLIPIKLNKLISLMADKQIKYKEVEQLRVRELKRYFLDNCLTNDIYLPPLIVNLENEEFEKMEPDKMTIIDGNVRLKALYQLKSTADQKERSADIHENEKGLTLNRFIDETYVCLHCFKELNESQVKQMFIDTNVKGKKVALSKLIAYDSRNEVNQITNEVLKRNFELQIAGVEMEKRAVIRPANKNFLSLSQLRKIVTVFLTGEIKEGVPKGEIYSNLSNEEHIDTISAWLNSLFKIHPPKTIGNYEMTILASFQLIHSIAYYSVRGTMHMTFQEKLSVINERMEKLSSVDFSSSNPLWEKFSGEHKGKDKLYYFKKDKETTLQLIDWLESLSVKEVREIY